ncbi:MAG: 5'-deoxynucleotidase [Paenibacillus sp.]|nr:5'-deoxynucleotidase [Paenibacillus sp.]
MNYHFSAYLYRLQYIQRWSLMRSTAPDNVAQHSFHVALLAHMLCSIGNVHYGHALNADRAAAIALFHDAAEVFTGDIPTPVKHNNQRLLSSFREMEAIAAERLTSMIPSELQSIYTPLMSADSSHSDPADNVLHSYVKAADSLDAYLKCVWEVAAGNREFAIAKAQTEAKLRGLALPEVDYFLTHMAPGFEMSLDELSAGN